MVCPSCWLSWSFPLLPAPFMNVVYPFKIPEVRGEQRVSSLQSLPGEGQTGQCKSASAIALGCRCEWEEGRKA